MKGMYRNRRWKFGPVHLVLGQKPSGMPYAVFLFVEYGPKRGVALIDWRAG